MMDSGNSGPRTAVSRAASTTSAIDFISRSAVSAGRSVHPGAIRATRSRIAVAMSGAPASSTPVASAAAGSVLCGARIRAVADGAYDTLLPVPTKPEPAGNASNGTRQRISCGINSSRFASWATFASGVMIGPSDSFEIFRHPSDARRLSSVISFAIASANACRFMAWVTAVNSGPLSPIRADTNRTSSSSTTNSTNARLASRGSSADPRGLQGS